jgi:hypothetical protein
MNKKYIKYLSAVIFILAITVASLLVYSSSSNNANSRQSGRISHEYSGPTQQEKNAGNTEKTKFESNNQGQETQTSSTINGRVVIVDSSQYDNIIEVRAYVGNVIENSGTCTITFTNSSHTLTKTTPAFADATTTQCKTLDVQQSEFNSSGVWNVNVKYNSNKTTGNANSMVTIK